MMKVLLIALSVFCLLQTSFANTFYLDPENGSINNNGSISEPFPSLEVVIANNMIESYEYAPLPYDPDNNQLVIKNLGAQITGGDTLILLEGKHGDIFLRGYSNEQNITVIGKTNEIAILKKLKLQACKNWVFQDLHVSSEPYGDYVNHRLVYIESHNWHGPSSKVEIQNCDIYSAENPWSTANEWLTQVSDGIYANGDSILISNNRLRNVASGITAAGDFITASNNEIVNFSKDGMRVLGSYILFEYNLIKNCYKIDDNHDDGIQSFTTGGTVVDNNILRANTIINYDDPDQILLGTLQGIGCFDGMYNNWIVENNLIIVDHWHGITFLGANNCSIINNTVLDPSPEQIPGPSWIRIANHKDGTASSDCKVYNNVANNFVIDAEGTNNTTLKTLEEYDQNFVDFQNYDLHLLESSPLVDAGESQFATQVDIEGTTRDISPDIGCYEYKLNTAQNKHSIESHFNISPNPSSNFIDVELSSNVNTVIVYSVTGATQYKVLITSKNSTRIDCSSWKSGMYFLQSFDKNNRALDTKKMIKL